MKLIIKKWGAPPSRRQQGRPARRRSFWNGKEGFAVFDRGFSEKRQDATFGRRDDGAPRFLAIFCLCASLLACKAGADLREGDIVFSGSSAGQGAAIRAATHSPYTHCGIIFQKDGHFIVLEAVQPVKISTFEEFKARSEPAVFCIKRPKIPLSDVACQKARTWAFAQIGKDYDGKFLWDNQRLYCSELVWKAYQHAGLELCNLRKLRDYDLKNPEVRPVLENRYGSLDRLPLDEKIVAPSDIANSKLLEDVAQEKL